MKNISLFPKMNYKVVTQLFILMLTTGLSIAHASTFVAGEDFVIGERWSPKVISKILKSPVDIEDVLGNEIGEFPLYNWMRYFINDTSIYEKVAPAISKRCKEHHGGDVMKTISCLANTTKKLIVNAEVPVNTFCRANNTLFRAAFEYLNLPRSHVFDVSASAKDSPHVVSRFILTAQSGQTYSYIIDVSSEPGLIYPNTKITEEWYKENQVHPKFSF